MPVKKKTPAPKKRRVAKVKKSTPNTRKNPENTREAGWQSRDDKLFALREDLKADPLLEALQEQADGDLNIARSVLKMESETISSLNTDTKGWNRIGGGSASEILPRNDGNRVRVLEQCYYLMYKNPLARNIIRSYTYLTLGTGMKVVFPADTDETTLKRWNTIQRNVNWQQRQRNIISLTYLLGEQFVLRHPRVKEKYWDEENGKPDREALTKHLSKVDENKVLLTNFTPKEITRVISSAKNREVPYFYEVRADEYSADRAGKLQGFYANDMSHFRIDDMGTTNRGRPILEPVLKYLSYYSMFLTDRLTMTAIRTRIPLIRKVKAANRKSVQTQMNTMGMPKAGKIAIVGTDEIWEYPGGPEDGASSEIFARTLRLLISAGVSLPEFLVTMDASNSNMASLLSASAPLVPMFESYRATFSQQFEDLIEEIVGVRPVVSFPSILRDNIETLVKAMTTMYRDKVISKRTYQIRTGLDPDVEEQQIEEENLEDADSQLGLEPEEPEEEEQDLTPPEEDDDEV